MNNQRDSSNAPYKVYKHLLAKSSDTPDFPKNPERLQGHIAQVLDAAETLLKEIANEILIQLGLDASIWRDRLKRAVMLGAFLHDFGKANDQFQEMVRGNRNVRINPQSVRHEALSGILCTSVKELRSWLCPPAVPDTDIIFQAALCSVVGHHLKTDRPTQDSPDLLLTVYFNHHDFEMLLRLGETRLELEKPPKFDNPRIFSLSDERRMPGIEALSDLKRKLYLYEGPRWFDRADQDTHKWLAAVKAIVIAADVTGSALPREGESVKKWISEALNDVLTAEDLKGLVEDRLKNYEPNPARDDFQRQVKESQDHITLVRAGCGAGKTAAAYLWASQRANGRKLFFCYPTTGTASEGFDGYVSKSKVEGTLMHSRAMVDLENIFHTPDDLLEVDQKGKTHEIADLRFESLQAWSPPLVVCTVDTVLGLIQNNRRGLYSFPAFARAAFVFDEVHSYDPKLFGALLYFLKTFRGADVMLMTASLPAHMLKALEEVCGGLVPIQGPKNRENAKRYRLRHLKENSDAQAWTEAKDTLKRNGKVLWVVNKVDRAIELYDRSRKDKLSANLYHSRFRYFERLDRHKAVVNAFDRKKNPGAAFAITTQVAEMSLDLSADLLITDLAPPASLIQRLGRLNRYEDEPGDTALALILETSDAKPYVKSNGEPSEDFLLAYQWLNMLPRDPAPASQTDLAIALEQIYKGIESQLYYTDSTWLEGCWKSEIDILRATDFSVPIVLQSDVQAIRDAGAGLGESARRNERRKEAIRRSLSIPGRPSVNAWQRLKEHGLYRIAPDDEIEYDEEIGARWR